MSPAKRRALQQRGGKRAHELGKAHRFTREEARLAGKRGGLAKVPKGRSKWKKA